MKAAGSSKTFPALYQLLCHHIHEDFNIHINTWIYINWEINYYIIFNTVNDGMSINIFVWVILFELYITEIPSFWD
jgi:hypothetical protein